MAVSVIELNTEQGDWLPFVIEFYADDNMSVPMNLTGSDINMTIRSYDGRYSLPLTNGNGRLTVTPLAGKIEGELTGTETDLLMVGRGTSISIDRIISGKKYPLAKGFITVTPKDD